MRIRLNIFLSFIFLSFCSNVLAQDIDIFAKQKVVIDNVKDNSDRGFDPGLKTYIRNLITDACVKSSDYEVIEVSMKDVETRIKEKGKTVNFMTICEEIGERADFIIFPSLRSQRSAVGSASGDNTIFISLSLYRISISSEVRFVFETSSANSHDLENAVNRLLSRMLLGNQSNGVPPKDNNSSDQAVESLSKGLAFYHGERYSEAVPHLFEAALQGNASAQYFLAESFYKGLGVAQNLSEAVNWYRKSAEQGVNDAQYMLGYCYYYGLGVTRDYSEAVKWLRKPAEQGYSKAEEMLRELGVSLR